MLGNPEAIFSSLKQLNLKDTQLNGADMQCLAEAIRPNQLPVLQLLFEKVHLDDLDLYVTTFAALVNVSLTLIISIETY